MILLLRRPNPVQILNLKLMGMVTQTMMGAMRMTTPLINGVLIHWRVHQKMIGTYHLDNRIM